MAILNGPFDFSGKFGNYSAYKKAGSDKIVLRRKGGPTRKQIKNAPQFERTRQINAEFLGCTMLATGIRGAVYPVSHLADFTINAVFNGIAKKMQVLDDVGEIGERGIFLSMYPNMLAGFNFNRVYTFDRIVSHPVTVLPLRTAFAATVSIPQLIPDISLISPWKLPYFRFIVSLGPVGDVVHKGTRYDSVDAGAISFQYTEWQHTTAPSDAFDCSLRLLKPATANVSLICCVGIEFGMPDKFDAIVPVRKAGAAKILAVF